MLKTVDLTQIRDECFGMSYEEYLAELRKPRSLRRGLDSVPKNMSMTHDSEMRFVDSIRRYHESRVFARS